MKRRPSPTGGRCPKDGRGNKKNMRTKHISTKNKQSAIFFPLGFIPPPPSQPSPYGGRPPFHSPGIAAKIDKIRTDRLISGKFYTKTQTRSDMRRKEEQLIHTSNGETT